MKKFIMLHIVIFMLLISSAVFAAAGGIPGRPEHPGHGGGKPPWAGNPGGPHSVPIAPEPVSSSLFVLGGAGLMAYKAGKKDK